jgi:hypothetical protein
LEKSGPPELRVFEGAATGYYSDEKAVLLFDAVAKGGPEGIEAHAVLCLLAAMLLDQVLPPKLAGHASKVLFEHAAVVDGRRYKTATRDLAVIARVRQRRDEEGISPSRNETSKHKDAASPSGCSLTASEFDLEERAVEEIWAKRNSFGLE